MSERADLFVLDEQGNPSEEMGKLMEACDIDTSGSIQDRDQLLQERWIAWRAKARFAIPDTQNFEVPDSWKSAVAESPLVPRMTPARGEEVPFDYHLFGGATAGAMYRRMATVLGDDVDSFYAKHSEKFALASERPLAQVDENWLKQFGYNPGKFAHEAHACRAALHRFQKGKDLQIIQAPSNWNDQEERFDPASLGQTVHLWDKQEKPQKANVNLVVSGHYFASQALQAANNITNPESTVIATGPAALKELPDTLQVLDELAKAHHEAMKYREKVGQVAQPFLGDILQPETVGTDA